MNDESLKKILNKLMVPPPDEAASAKARYRAEVAFANRPAGVTTPLASSSWERRLGLLGAVCVVVSLICFGLLHDKQPAGEIFSEQKLLAEMEALFPGQLDGVISSEGNVSVDLATDARTTSGPSSQPLAVTLQRGREIVRVLGYSGRKVCVNLDGRKRCLEPLVTAEGSVIVEGDDFLWTNAHPTLVAGYHVDARTLSL